MRGTGSDAFIMRQVKIKRAWNVSKKPSNFRRTAVGLGAILDTLTTK